MFKKIKSVLLNFMNPLDHDVKFWVGVTANNSFLKLASDIVVGSSTCVHLFDLTIARPGARKTVFVIEGITPILHHNSHS